MKKGIWILIAFISTTTFAQKAEDLKKWYGVEKILRNQQTNEYLFVNLIPEAEIVKDDE